MSYKLAGGLLQGATAMSSARAGSASRFARGIDPSIAPIKGREARKKLWILLVLLILAVSQKATAQTYSLAGVWQGHFRGISQQLVLQPNGIFSTTQQGFDYYLWMTGSWAVMPGQNVIQFRMLNYEPKNKVVHPAEVWGGTFEFTSPNSFIWRGFAGPVLEYRRQR